MAEWDLWRVERIIRRAGHQLAESLWDYWPTENENELSERNISTQLAASFGGRGFRAFAEVHSKGRVDQRFDLFLLNHDEQVALCVESKRLYSTEQARRILADVERILTFVSRDEDVPNYRRFGVIAATTWQRDIAEWWSSLDGKSPSDDDIWKELSDHDALADAHWGSVVIQGLDTNSPATKDFHFLLYMVFEIS